MTVYVAAVEDSYSEPETRAFDLDARAVVWARENFLACLERPGDAIQNYGENGHLWAGWSAYETPRAWVDAVALEDDRPVRRLTPAGSASPTGGSPQACRTR